MKDEWVYMVSFSLIPLRIYTSNQIQKYINKIICMTKLVIFLECMIISIYVKWPYLNGFRKGLQQSSMPLHDKTPEGTRNRRNISQFHEDYI